MRTRRLSALVHSGSVGSIILALLLLPSCAAIPCATPVSSDESVARRDGDESGASAFSRKLFYKAEPRWTPRSLPISARKPPQ